MLSNKDLDIQKLQVRVLVIYVGIIFALTISMMVGIIAATNNVLTNKISALVASNSHQLENNINSYLKRVELNAALMFSDEKYYKYDATTTSLDEYEKIKCQDEIAEKISDLGLMENYSDFAVLYSDGTRVGWTSNTTAGLFTGSALYNEF